MRYLVLALLLLGCGPRQKKPVIVLNAKTVMLRWDISWRFDCTFPENDKVVVVDSFTYWNKVLNRKLFHQVSCNEVSADLTVYAIHDIRCYPDDPTNCNPRIGGTGYPDRINLYESWLDEKSKYMQESIVRHEIFHSVGGKHGTDPDCLMFPYISDTYRYQVKTLCHDELISALTLYGDP